MSRVDFFIDSFLQGVGCLIATALVCLLILIPAILTIAFVSWILNQ